jgi:hypothetical protein
MGASILASTIEGVARLEDMVYGGHSQGVVDHGVARRRRVGRRARGD